MFMKKIINNIFEKVLILLRFRKTKKTQVKRLVYNKNSEKYEFRRKFK